MKIEQLILKKLIKDEDFTRQTLPYIKEEYFADRKDVALFKAIRSFVTTYNTQPSTDALSVMMESETRLSDDDRSDINSLLNNVASEQQDNPHEKKWLVKEAEKFCQDRAIHNAILESAHIIQDPKSKKDKGIIPDLLKEALGVSFDENIGHDFYEDAKKRFEYYHRRESKIPFRLKMFNQITNGGIPPRTLSVIVGGVNCGKTLTMCDLTTSWMMQGYDVLYVTGEMSEEEISKRIDANLLDISMAMVDRIPEDQYFKLLALSKEKYKGRLKVKWYPTGNASIINIKHAIRELQLKKNYSPQIVVIDYIGNFTSSHFKKGAVNSYTFFQSVAEEFRGFAGEEDIRVVTAHQLNRSGFSDSDMDMDSIADSFGINAVADFIPGLIVTDELRTLNQVMIKQLKNRFSDKQLDRKFVVGVDTSKMRLYDINNPEVDIHDEGPPQEYNYVIPPPSQKVKDIKKKFDEFKFS